MIRPITVVWPDEDIPLPLVDFSAGPDNQSIFSPPNLFASLRRSRFTHSFDNLSVSWSLTPTQYAALKEFFELDLGCGAALFVMELKFPKNSALSDWVVQFIDSLSADYASGRWEVRSTIRLLSPKEV